MFLVNKWPLLPFKGLPFLQELKTFLKLWLL